MDLEHLAQLYESDAGGALRTVLGAAHRHWIAVLPSFKTGWSNPVEGAGEEALAADSEIDAEITYFQTQAFRLRMVIDGRRTEWICDHLRQFRWGRVQAIEVKQTPHQMDGGYLRKIQMARSVLATIGWEVIILYENGIIGSPARQENRANLLMDRSVSLEPRDLAAVKRLRRNEPATTFGRLRRALSGGEATRRAKAHAVLASGRARTDLDRLLDDASPIELLAPLRRQ